MRQGQLSDDDVSETELVVNDDDTLSSYLGGLFVQAKLHAISQQGLLSQDSEDEASIISYHYILYFIRGYKLNV